jgi:hypothetical protein
MKYMYRGTELECPEPPLLNAMNEAPPTLEEVQSFVGGIVEVVRLPGGAQLLVNEEGLIYGLPLNKEATQIAGQSIVGNALVLRGKARWR